MISRTIRSGFAILTLSLCGVPLFAQPASDPDSAIQGEYAGVIYGGYSQRAVGVQLVALGEGKFKAVVHPGGLPGAGYDGGPRQEFDAARTDDYVIIQADPKKHWLILGDELSVIDRETMNLEAVLKKQHRQNPTLGAAPPPGAIILFDGTSTAEWDNGRIDVDGLLMQGPVSKRAFRDFTLHVEFLLPFMPAERGQGRANSGVYLQKRYEVQILDSFGLAGESNECGGLYTLKKPDVNMCLPPLSWQTYDIDFRAARFSASQEGVSQDGVAEHGAAEKTEPARLTVRHNGVLIHDDVAISDKTGNGLPEKPSPGPLALQDHGNPVRFRNVWVVER